MFKFMLMILIALFIGASCSSSPLSKMDSTKIRQGAVNKNVDKDVSKDFDDPFAKYYDEEYSEEIKHNLKSIYFAPGLAKVAFPENVSKKEGFQGWVVGLTKAVFATDETITQSEVISKEIEE